MNSASPYLSETNRLADVIAAIQTMGTYKFYKLDFEGWSDRISGDKTKADLWRNVFEEHPEFFRLDSGKQKASLVWRRQFPKQYNVDTETKISKEDFINLSSSEKMKISRIPLNSEDIGMLIKTAIDMHSRALQHKQEKRWLLIPIITAISALLGALIGGLVK